MIIETLIKANSKKSEVNWDKDIKIHAKNPPSKGKANKEVIGLLKEYFKTPHVVLIKGFTNTTKYFEIKDAKAHMPD